MESQHCIIQKVVCKPQRKTKIINMVTGCLKMSCTEYYKPVGGYRMPGTPTSPTFAPLS